MVFNIKTRVISGAVAVIIAAAVLFLYKTVVFYLFVSLLCTVAVYEVCRAAKCLNNKLTVISCLIFSAIYPMMFFLKIEKHTIALTTLFVFIVFLLFLTNHKTSTYNKVFVMLGATLLITFALTSMIKIMLISEEHGLFLLVLSLCGAWLADTGAYFAGTLFGKHKLCPEISPKKTVEGLIGGTITNAFLFILIGFIYTKINSDAELNYILLALCGMACSLLGLLGDLSASMLKRQCNIKDYGNIMPGHGGIMDRFDSVLFVAPFMHLVGEYLVK